jgi:Tetratricopeptide repeat/Cytochrome c554 and c-prime
MTSRIRRGTLLAGAAVVFGVAVLVGARWLGFGQPPVADPRLTFATPYRNVRPEVPYAGDDACAECHAGQVNDYRQHPMGRSLAPVARVVAAQRGDEGAGNPFEADGFRYRVDRDGERLVHRQISLGPDGQVLADVRAEVAYVVGSGERAHSYLIDRDGYLFQSPISWFAQRQTWDLSPGYAERRLGFGRAIRPECLFCHANRAEAVPDTVNHYREPVFQGLAIGCERCHGPGGLHVARRRKGEGGGVPDYDVVNPARLEPSLREAVCQQCHLQGASRVVRRGRDLYDYRPGLPLHLFWAVFVRGPESQEQQLVGHVEQMHQSRCFLQTRGPGQLGCTSCHDPHAVPPAGGKVAFFRDRCLKCHEDHGCSLPPARRRETNPEDSCIACHMPRHASADVTHVATTDHRVVRRTDAAAAPAGPRVLRPGESPLVHFHADLADPHDPEAGRDLGLALVELAQDPSPVQRQLAETALGLLDEAVRRGPEDVPAWEGRGRALHLLGRDRDALACAEKALARAPGREPSLAGAAVYAESLGQRDASLASWGRALAVNPLSAEYRFRRAQLLSEAGDWPGALADCDEVLRGDPANVEMRLLRVSYYVQAGDRARARAEFETVLALHPRQPEAVQRWFAEKMR